MGLAMTRPETEPMLASVTVEHVLAEVLFVRWEVLRGLVVLYTSMCTIAEVGAVFCTMGLSVAFHSVSLWFGSMHT